MIYKNLADFGFRPFARRLARPHRFLVTSFKAKPLRRLPPRAVKAHAAPSPIGTKPGGVKIYEPIRTDPGGALEAVKFPREGAGLLSSLIETDGLVWRRVTLSRR